MRVYVITLTRGDGYERLCVHMPAIWEKAVTDGGSLFCYGDEENARIYVVHLMTAN